MSGLQEAFYIVALVYMGFGFLIMIAILVALLKIRAKINHIHDRIDSKLNTITSIAEKIGGLTAAAGSGVLKKAKKAMK